MNIRGSQTIAAPPAEVWPVLRAGSRLAQAIPDCHLLETLDGNHHRIALDGSGWPTARKV